MVAVSSDQTEAQAVEQVIAAVEAALRSVRSDPSVSPVDRLDAETELKDVLRSLVRLMGPPSQDRMF